MYCTMKTLRPGGQLSKKEQTASPMPQNIELMTRGTGEDTGIGGGETEEIRGRRVSDEELLGSKGKETR